MGNIKIGRLLSIFIVFFVLASYAMADIGTKPKDYTEPMMARMTLSPELLAVSTGLRPVVTENGKVSVSIDGLGTLSSSGLIQVQKPVGATVRKAYMAAASTGFTDYQITNTDISIDGTSVVWDTEIANSIGSFNYWADVTSIVKPIVDAAPAGIIDLTIGEALANTYNIDGESLIVIFDDPNQLNDNTVY